MKSVILFVNNCCFIYTYSYESIYILMIPMILMFNHVVVVVVVVVYWVFLETKISKRLVVIPMNEIYLTIYYWEVRYRQRCILVVHPYQWRFYTSGIRITYTKLHKYKNKCISIQIAEQRCNGEEARTYRKLPIPIL